VDPLPLLDQAVLDELRELLEESFPEAIASFVTDIEARLPVLTAAAGTGDRETLARQAHALKSGAASIGAMQVSEHCRELEEAVRGGTLDDPEDAVQAIVAAYQAVQPSLRAAQIG
jgi:HPt (histidine-containing phosphotransfer) domain-containing protein